MGSGDRDEAVAILAEIDDAAHPFAAGLVRASLGDIEPAFGAFRRVEVMSAWPTLAIHHHYRAVWEPLRDDPRFQELRRKAGFKQ